MTITKNPPSNCSCYFPGNTKVISVNSPEKHPVFLREKNKSAQLNSANHRKTSRGKGGQNNLRFLSLKRTKWKQRRDPKKTYISSKSLLFASLIFSMQQFVLIPNLMLNKKFTTHCLSCRNFQKFILNKIPGTIFIRLKEEKKQNLFTKADSPVSPVVKTFSCPHISKTLDGV